MTLTDGAEFLLAEIQRYREVLARIVAQPNRATYLARVALNDPENAVNMERAGR